jgi:DtxR family Mn-dependent transcriptional regulator
MIPRRSIRYLAAIYAVGKGSPVRLIDIARFLNITPPAAFDYILRLIDHGLVERIGRGLYRLTPRGIEVLSSRIKIHGIIEILLHTYLGLPLDKACIASSRIEDMIDPVRIENICSILGHPERCPHGDPLPHNDTGILAELSSRSCIFRE